MYTWFFAIRFKSKQFETGSNEILIFIHFEFLLISQFWLDIKVIWGHLTLEIFAFETVSCISLNEQSKFTWSI